MQTKSFQALHLNDAMLQVVEQLYFKEPTDIQQKVIPEILNGKSIIGQSQTGSGKTHAYLLPLLNNIEDDVTDAQVVITAPTRELAMQINEDVKKIITLLHKEDVWQSRLIIGGIDRQRMMRQLRNKGQIIIGTPGRILDMVNEGVLSIYSAHAFVIDEADLMLDFRFIEKIDELLVKSKPDVQILVFSATIPVPLQHFFKKYLKNPLHIEVKNGIAPEKMEHRLINKKHRNVHDLIIQLSDIIQPYVALLFTNSKESADELGKVLQQAGLDVGVLHGGLSSRQRTRVVRAINDLQYQYVVATDLASRGIDIKGTSHVINVELPKELQFYIHRVGRTARAGLEGTAISFYDDDDISLIKELENKGIQFDFTNIKNGNFVEAKRYDQRQQRRNKMSNVDQKAWKQVRRPKKVKPGYKKKMKYEQEKIKRRMLKQARKRKR